MQHLETSFLIAEVDTQVSSCGKCMQHLETSFLIAEVDTQVSSCGNVCSIWKLVFW